MKKTTLLAVGLILSSCPVRASPNADVELIIDKMVGTLKVYTQPQMFEGKLAGCQYVFDAVVRDWSYRKGRPLKVSGSLAIVTMSKNIGTTLKVVVNEVKMANDFRLEFTPSPPTRAYLIDQKMNTNIDSLLGVNKSDTPGGLFAIFSPSPTMEMILDAMSSRKITVAFNQNNGSTDLQLPIDLSVEDTDDNGLRKRSDVAASDFAMCTQRLVEQLE